MNCGSSWASVGAPDSDMGVMPVRRCTACGIEIGLATSVLSNVRPDPSSRAISMTTSSFRRVSYLDRSATPCEDILHVPLRSCSYGTRSEILGESRGL